MSEIPGRYSIVAGALYLAKHRSGNGVLLGGVPEVLPGKMVIIGGGTSGVNAARMARGLGADQETQSLIDRDGQVFLHQSVSTPCLSARKLLLIVYVDIFRHLLIGSSK